MLNPLSLFRNRCLIIVRNGVAEYVCDQDVDVELFDFDSYESSPDETSPPSLRFLQTLQKRWCTTFEGLKMLSRNYVLLVQENENEESSDPLVFDCMAEDYAHACEQALDAYRGSRVIDGTRMHPMPSVGDKSGGATLMEFLLGRTRSWRSVPKAASRFPRHPDQHSECSGIAGRSICPRASACAQCP